MLLIESNLTVCMLSAINTFAFSTLFTDLPLNLVKKKLLELVGKTLW